MHWFRASRPLLSLALAGLLCAACEAAPTTPAALKLGVKGSGTPVLSFEGDALSVEALERHFAQMRPTERARYGELAARREYVEGLGRFELLAAEALRRGLLADPEVARTTKRALVQRLMRQELEEKLPPVTDAEVRAFFDAHRADYGPAGSVSFAQVAGQVRERLYAQRRDAAYARLLREVGARLDYRVHEDALGKVAIDPDAPTVPGGMPPALLAAPGQHPEP